MSVTNSFNSAQPWMFSDPYAYQYADIPEDTPSQGFNAAGSIRFELECPVPYTAPSTPTVEYAAELDGSSGAGLKKNGSIMRSQCSSRRTSTKYAPRRWDSKRFSDLPEVVEDARPAPRFSHLMPFQERATRPQQSNRLSTFSGLMVVDEEKPARPKQSNRLSTFSGQLVVDEEKPSQDFDAILRNVALAAPVKRGIGLGRSGRYCDRFNDGN
ncbi:Uu.00g034420.m01.CDS01 [Anthostomella pinea]|uniref:Uu.00g034420.m01.CDS01 n=1 Tax=Anthostomella pinea TaxID=933095 RepID=A0AAI8V8X2_9PEZI|nr:Uu.00g034420.m01.CDS01 [Anthostomella pinea]